MNDGMRIIMDGREVVRIPLPHIGVKLLPLCGVPFRGCRKTKGVCISMEERLKTYLRPGEQVRWQGRPAPFSLLEAEAKKQILLKWGLTVALGGGLLAVYLSGTEAPSMGFIGLVLLVAAVILISPVAERRNLMGEQYWITNQRAILMTRDKTFFYMELSDIDDLQVVGGTTKGKSLVLGRCLFEEAKKLLRWRACHPKVDVQSHDETDRALGMIFYGVQGAEAAAELLRQGRDGEAA